MPTKVEVETNPQVEETWDQIDKERVKLEVESKEEELNQRLSEQQIQISLTSGRPEKRDRLSDGIFVNQLVDCWLEIRMDSLPREFLRAFRATWMWQGYAETRVFLQTVWERGLVPLLDELLGEFDPWFRWCVEDMERETGSKLDKDVFGRGLGRFLVRARDIREKIHHEVELLKPSAENEPAQAEAMGAIHPDKLRKSENNKYGRFWKKRLEGLHPSQMRKTEKYLVKADLTIAERDCYSLRVGHSKTFAEIASRMGYTHHSTAQEHFEKAKAKVEERNSQMTRKHPQR